MTIIELKFLGGQLLGQSCSEYECARNLNCSPSLKDQEEFVCIKPGIIVVHSFLLERVTLTGSRHVDEACNYDNDCKEKLECKKVSHDDYACRPEGM